MRNRRLLQSIVFCLISMRPALAEVPAADAPAPETTHLQTQEPAEKTTPNPVGQLIGVPASPAAVDPTPGTGALGRWLGLRDDSPWGLSGVWVGNGSDQLGGGVAQSGNLGGAQQFLLNLSLDLDRSLGWQGGKIWVQGLQMNANRAATAASGSLQGSIAIASSVAPDRTELYSYVFSQDLFDNQVRLLAGKIAASNDFANVVVPVIRPRSPYTIPSISSLTYTPLYSMPTLQGRVPGYPNPALGASLLIQPKAFKRDAWLKLGIFDGRGGSGVQRALQTGLATPSLSGPLFSIGELGGTWTAGRSKKPGSASIGLWHQGGPLNCASSNCAESSAAGGYLIAHQRLASFRYPADNSGITSFLQAGWSPARSNLFSTSIGGGFTLFAPIRSRPLDSYGIGLSWAKINEHGAYSGFSNPSELMIQIYGQIHLISNLYLTPAFTVLPIAGRQDATTPSTSAQLQLVAFF
jgi:porin